MTPFSAYSSPFKGNLTSWCQDPFCSGGDLCPPLWPISCAPSPAYTCARSLSLSLPPPCLCTGYSLIGEGLCSHFFTPHFFLIVQRSGHVSRPSFVRSMVCPISLPRKFLSLQVRRLCACLSPLLTQTPWGQGLGLSAPCLYLTPLLKHCRSSVSLAEWMNWSITAMDNVWETNVCCLSHLVYDSCAFVTAAQMD